ncbi:hypothetical protein HanRHA438_Chr11g0505951 [Helianthus annuus]|nr:hypothetical protein HanRHA438_Chr11g0505951 [Helianthus annuus]
MGQGSQSRTKWKPHQTRTMWGGFPLHKIRTWWSLVQKLGPPKLLNKVGQVSLMKLGPPKLLNKVGQGSLMKLGPY